MEIDDLPQPPPHAEAERRRDMHTVQPMSQYAAPPGLQRRPRTSSSREGEAQIGFQHEPHAESRSSREGEYEVRPQSSSKQRAQDKKPGNNGELKFLQAQLESLGIDSSFTGFLEDPIGHYVVSKLIDIATSERREKEQLIEEREHLARSKQEMESQLMMALAKRQISPPMATPATYSRPINDEITSSHSDTTPRRELPLPYNEVSAPRGMGPKVPNARRNTATNPPRIEVHCTVPHNYPRGEQKLIQDPTLEEDQTTEENPLEESQPGESTDEETSKEEELERLSTPEKNAEPKASKRSEKHYAEAKRARLAEETAQKARGTETRDQEESLTP
ncbi:hypothetical protein BD779DRAFT_1681388 [Infundibulicybe gibba]|nr:hypothetical protein BD779DRAFT_1681388 [Infundibulicybe gibba]